MFYENISISLKYKLDKIKLTSSHKIISEPFNQAYLRVGGVRKGRL